MVALGAAVYSYLTYRHPWRKKLLSSEQFFNLFFIAFCAAVIGGRFLFVLSSLSSFKQNWLEIFYPWVGGFSLFGSVIFVLVALYWYLKKLKLSVLPFFDMVTLRAPLVVAIARIGCFLAGCCYGVETTLPWGVTFSNADALAPLHVPLHPTQLYASVISFLIFLILLFIEKKAYVASGTIVFTYLLLGSISRFFVDFLRGDRILLGALSVEQWVTAAICIASLGGLIFILMRRRKSRCGVDVYF